MTQNAMRRCGLLAVGMAVLSWCPSVGADRFLSDWHRDPDRLWVGEQYHANRWQDWRIQNGRLECTEVAKRLPMRTVQVLTDVLDPAAGSIFMRVHLGVIDADAPVAENAWGGFSLGAGGPDVDYRRTAMVHHMPAADGGILVVVDGNGAVALRDNEQVPGKTGSWSIVGDVTADDLALLPGTEIKAPPPNTRIPSDGVELRVRVTQAEEGYVLRAEVFDAEGDVLLSSAQATGIPLSKIQGGFGLVSHHGPQKSQDGWWFSRLLAEGPGVQHRSGREFGPIIGTLYTLDDDVLKMTAQFPPLGEDDQWTTALQIQPEQNAHWETVATASIDRDSRTATFRIEDWKREQDTPYRVVYSQPKTDGTQVGAEYLGVIRAEPAPDAPLVLGALTCHKTYTGGLAWNGSGLWLPHEELVAAVETRNPDMLFFSGDQIYEGDLTPAGQRNEDAYILDYLWKYSHWIWAFRDVTRDRPTVVIPDDHDVYHGNIWGAGGRRAKAGNGLSAQDSGGYKQAPRFVNAVHRTQVAHLPDPIDPTPIGEGYSVYYTDMEYGGISFAIISDRQFKESPSVAVPDGKVKNGWFTAEGFDVVSDGDAPDAPLLGKRQEVFLEDWSQDWSPGIWMKVLLSQTPFACVQTLPNGKKGGSQPGLVIFEPEGYAPSDLPCSDADSNGWPQSGRNRALSLLQPAQVLHICGDQHLAFVAQYGLDAHRDSGVVFCTPAIANTWPRRWMPRDLNEDGSLGAPRPFGNHFDGFGNRISVDAVANPHKRGIEPTALHDRSPGFGIVRFQPQDGTIALEAWQRGTGLRPDIGQYEGWPITLASHQLTGDSWLFRLRPTLGDDGRPFAGTGDLIEVRHAEDGALVRFARVMSQTDDIWRVPAEGHYEVSIIGDDGQLLRGGRFQAEPIN